MLYIPPQTGAMQDIMGRATAMMLSLKNWNVSVRLLGENAEPAVTGAVRLHVPVIKGHLGDLRGFVSDIARGLPLGKRPSGAVDATEVHDLQQRSMDEVRNMKQTVLQPLPQAPQAKVVGKSGKRDRSQGPATRGSGKDEAAAAKEKERLSNEKAAKKARAQREQDIAAANAKEPPRVPRKQAGLRPPREPLPPGAKNSAKGGVEEADF